MRNLISSSAALILALGILAPADAAPPEARPAVYIIGQDLDSVRGYVASGCCGQADGATAYVALYKILSPELDFGGLGLDADGNPVAREADWGGGPSSAYKTATEFGVRDLAVGLFIANNEQPGGPSADQPSGMAELVAGKRDREIRQLAKLARHVRGTMYLRIGYEFDGAWNQGHEDRAVYIAAWRRIVDVLRREGADNIAFVWQASASPVDDIIDQAHDDLAGWYPGDSYVDWIAFSWFVSPDDAKPLPGGYRPPTARALMDEVTAFARARGKPVMIAEAAPQGFDLKRGFRANISPLWDGPAAADRRTMSADAIWDAWYVPFFAYLSANRDVVRAIAYINCDWDVQDLWNPPYESGFWGDTRLEANPTIAARWTTAIAQWRSAR